MPRDISFLQYMRAHGNTTGPTQRPLLTGAIGGLLAFAPFELVMQLSGARESIARGFGISQWVSISISAAVMVVAGLLYAGVFKRAANDFHGGWLFGASFGFLLWMVAPVTLWQLLTGRPIAVGTAAMGLFAGHILFGIALGLVFPWVHFLLQRRLNEANDEAASLDEKPLVAKANPRIHS